MAYYEEGRLHMGHQSATAQAAPSQGVFPPPDFEAPVAPLSAYHMAALSYSPMLVDPVPQVGNDSCMVLVLATINPQCPCATPAPQWPIAPH